MADEKDETTTQEQQPSQQKPEVQQQLTDKHGEPAISKGRYEREMQTKDAEIAALKDQLKELSEQARTTRTSQGMFPVFWTATSFSKVFAPVVSELWLNCSTTWLVFTPAVKSFSVPSLPVRYAIAPSGGAWNRQTRRKAASAAIGSAR